MKVSWEGLSHICSKPPTSMSYHVLSNHFIWLYTNLSTCPPTCLSILPRLALFQIYYFISLAKILIRNRILSYLFEIKSGYTQKSTIPKSPNKLMVQLPSPKSRSSMEAAVHGRRVGRMPRSFQGKMVEFLWEHHGFANTPAVNRQKTVLTQEFIRVIRELEKWTNIIWANKNAGHTVCFTNIQFYWRINSSEEIKLCK